jgi:hypothetical protein
MTDTLAIQIEIESSPERKRDLEEVIAKRLQGSGKIEITIA